MNKKIFKSQWSRVKGTVQDWWNDFTDEEVDRVNGEWSALVREVQEKYNYSESEAKEEIEEFMAEIGDDEEDYESYEDDMNEDDEPL